MTALSLIQRPAQEVGYAFKVPQERLNDYIPAQYEERSVTRFQGVRCLHENSIYHAITAGIFASGKEIADRGDVAPFVKLRERAVEYLRDSNNRTNLQQDLKDFWKMRRPNEDTPYQETDPTEEQIETHLEAAARDSSEASFPEARALSAVCGLRVFIYTERPRTEDICGVDIYENGTKIADNTNLQENRTAAPTTVHLHHLAGGDHFNALISASIPQNGVAITAIRDSVDRDIDRLTMLIDQQRQRIAGEEMTLALINATPMAEETKGIWRINLQRTINEMTVTRDERLMMLSTGRERADEMITYSLNKELELLAAGCGRELDKGQSTYELTNSRRDTVEASRRADLAQQDAVVARELHAQAELRLVEAKEETTRARGAENTANQMADIARARAIEADLLAQAARNDTEAAMSATEVERERADTLIEEAAAANALAAAKEQEAQAARNAVRIADGIAARATEEAQRRMSEAQQLTSRLDQVNNQGFWSRLWRTFAPRTA